MKASTILAVFGLAGLGAAQGSSSVKPATVSPPPPPPSSSPIFRNGTTTTITTVVSQFVTVCPSPTTFYVGTVCYTATSSNQPVTVTNCPCTVQSVCTTPYVTPVGTTCIVTGALVTTPAAQNTAPAAPVAPVAPQGTGTAGAQGQGTAGAQGQAPAAPVPTAVSTAGAAGATVTAKPTNTAYVTAGGSKPTLMMSLMGFFMSLPVFAVMLL